MRGSSGEPMFLFTRDREENDVFLWTITFTIIVFAVEHYMNRMLIIFMEERKLTHS